MTQSVPLSGQVAVITGAASGIGREAALAFSRAGAHVLAADLDAEGLAETVRRIAADGGQARAHAADLTSPGAVVAAADAAEAMGRIGVWINVAGVAGMAPVEDTTDAFHDRIVAINQTAVFNGCREAARRMIPHRHGVILNVSSNAADQPIPGLAVYAMTKAAVNMLTRSLAAELGRHGVRVNCVAPGFIETEMTTAHLSSDADRASLLAGNAKRSPLGLTGLPEDVAEALLYLADPRSGRFVTGQILRVNGGCAMP